jgi:hypothetical protein
MQHHQGPEEAGQTAAGRQGQGGTVKDGGQMAVHLCRLWLPMPVAAVVPMSLVSGSTAAGIQEDERYNSELAGDSTETDRWQYGVQQYDPLTCPGCC